MIQDVREKFAARVGAAIEEIELSKYEQFKPDKNNEPFYIRDRLLFTWGCKLRNLNEVNGDKGTRSDIRHFLKDLEVLSVGDPIFSLFCSREYVFYFAIATEERIILFQKMNLN